MKGLSTHSLTARYGEHTVLRDLSLTFARGELTAVLGVNGSGKSTLMRSLAGIGPAASSVRLGERELSSLTRKEIARAIAYVPQIAHAAEDMTVLELVALGRYAHDRGGSVEIEAALGAVSLTAFRDRRVGAVSGGELRRAWVARALCQVNAEGYILLDEPTAHLDPRHALSLLGVLRERAEQGNGVLLATHDLSAAVRTADRLIVLKEAGVLFDGPPRELSADVLKRGFGLIARVDEDEEGRFLRVLDVFPVDSSSPD